MFSTCLDPKGVGCSGVDQQNWFEDVSAAGGLLELFRKDFGLPTSFSFSTSVHVNFFLVPFLKIPLLQEHETDPPKQNECHQKNLKDDPHTQTKMTSINHPTHHCPHLPAPKVGKHTPSLGNRVRSAAPCAAALALCGRSLLRWCGASPPPRVDNGALPQADRRRRWRGFRGTRSGR